MTEIEELNAEIGRLHVLSRKQDAGYTQVLGLLAGVVSGRIDRSRVLVNLTDRSWMLSEPGTTPATPATVNGLPEYVVGPPAPPVAPATINGLPEFAPDPAAAEEPNEHPRPE